MPDLHGAEQLWRAKQRFMTRRKFGSRYFAHPLDSLREVVVPDLKPRGGPTSVTGGPTPACLGLPETTNIPSLGEKLYGNLVVLRRTAAFMRAT